MVRVSRVVRLSVESGAEDEDARQLPGNGEE
jgi:hypothetical protein